MKTLIVYDNNGKIFTSITGNYEKPNGLKHIEVEVPVGKYVYSVNPFSMEPLFKDLPKGEVETLRLELEETKAAMLELADAILGGTR